MRLVIELRKDLNNPNLRHLCIVKGNYLPQSAKESSIVLEMDENMVFTATGDRVPLGNLKKPFTNTGIGHLVKEKVLQLRADGNSYREISTLLTAAGNKVSKTAVADIVKENMSVQHITLGEKDKGQEE